VALRLITLKDVYSNDKPYIVIWTRDEKGIRHQEVISVFKPYFYVLERDRATGHSGI